ncbi:MAG: hypothetical protein GMKNLPBB_01478 [Myxococcota bacterium]|nr:hypothetical protein [Myxococcota bacterium]
MIKSMTGFGGGSAAASSPFVVEIKTVNHKSLDFRVRLPREISALETRVQDAIRKRLARGAVDITVKLHGETAVLSRPHVHMALARETWSQLQQLHAALGLTTPLQLNDLLRIEGVVTLEDAVENPDAVWELLEPALRQALDELIAMRSREGEHLRAELLSRLAAFEKDVEKLKPLLPAQLTRARERLAARMAELAGDRIDENRIAQEVAVWADRMDVAEELARLQGHLTQFRGLLDSDEPVGRKLEFLCQELHREVNTLGAKSQSAEISALVIALKAEVERLREQSANME